MRPLFLFAILAGPAVAQDQLSDQISFLETGVICAPESVGTAPAPDTVAGVTNIIVDDPPFVSTVNRVPAVLGIGFGAKATAADGFGINDVDVILTHPAMGPQAATMQSYRTSIRGNGTSITFYQFDYAYELLPGRWTMEARKDGALLYRSEFDVLPPAMVPELASICGFEALLS